MIVGVFLLSGVRQRNLLSGYLRAALKYVAGVGMNNGNEKWILTVFCGSKSFSRIKTNS